MYKQFLIDLAELKFCFTKILHYFTMVFHKKGIVFQYRVYALRQRGHEASPPPPFLKIIVLVHLISNRLKVVSIPVYRLLKNLIETCKKRVKFSNEQPEQCSSYIDEPVKYCRTVLVLVHHQHCGGSWKRGQGNTCFI